MLTADKHARRLSLVDFPTPVGSFTRVKIPKNFNGRNPQSRRDLASTLRNRTHNLTPPPPGRAPGGRRPRARRIRRTTASRSCARPARAPLPRLPRPRGPRPLVGALVQARPGRERPSSAASSSAPTRSRGSSTGSATCSPRWATSRARGQLPVTERGRTLMRIYNEMDLLTAESLRAGLWDGLDPSALAAVLSTLVYESRRPDDAAAPRLPGGRVKPILAEMVSIWSDLDALEREHHLDQLHEPDLGFAWAAYRWAEGDELDDVLDATDLAAGDFVRWVKQLLDLTDQVADAAGERRPARGRPRGLTPAAPRRGRLLQRQRVALRGVRAGRPAGRCRAAPPRVRPGRCQVEGAARRSRPRQSSPSRSPISSRGEEQVRLRRPGHRGLEVAPDRARRPGSCPPGRTPPAIAPYTGGRRTDCRCTKGSRDQVVGRRRARQIKHVALAARWCAPPPRPPARARPPGPGPCRETSTPSTVQPCSASQRASPPSPHADVEGAPGRQRPGLSDGRPRSHHHSRGRTCCGSARPRSPRSSGRSTVHSCCPSLPGDRSRACDAARAARQRCPTRPWETAATGPAGSGRHASEARGRPPAVRHRVEPRAAAHEGVLPGREDLGQPLDRAGQAPLLGDRGQHLGVGGRVGRVRSGEPRSMSRATATTVGATAR